MKWRIALWIACLLVLLISLSDAARKGGRRKTKHRKMGSSRLIFYTNARRKEYYDNENGAKIIKASHFDYEFILGHKISFICAAKGDPRPRITWFKDGIELHAHPYLQITTWQKEHDYIKSKLEITPARQMDSGTYDCEANNKYSIDRRSFKADFGSISK
ncbi:immunoglobulin domain-containing protein oig-4 [Parasteatoda tepidariorum]|uniref:immunoglobulin domain-containing protein oig-4 n=1 Tax=Parasteatoda tepidariorum TaxID=114398 RepID=UPI00077FBA34|nr:immunoglobulin domain-containing protein oig-4 [Parasteatoda tepidariorum]XP_015911878.1 immunoglobulin domain-containing protein oig-4 [Parasteatoda tepidariorum]